MFIKINRFSYILSIFFIVFDGVRNALIFGNYISYIRELDVLYIFTGDNYHPENSHVVPALIRRIHEAKQNALPEVVIWGTGTPKREFLHVDDMAEASVFVMNLDSDTYQSHTQPMLSHINVGTGKECSILELAQMIAKVVGYQGLIITDPSKPDVTPRKLMSVERLKQLGWQYHIELENGISNAYQWFLENHNTARGL